MQIQNAIITGSFSYNGADLSNVTSSNAYSASLSSRTTDLESTSSVLVGASASFSSILSSVSSSQQQISSSFLTLTASFNAVSASQQQISASYIALSASYNTFSGSASTRITANSSSIQQVSSSQQQISSSLLNVISIFATTGSNSFRETQSITGSLTVTGQIIAQTINVQQVTSSIIYSSGSNNFGCDLNSRQTFTGSVLITGSLTIAGASSATSYSGTTIYGSTAVCSPIGCFATSCATSFIGGTMSGTTIYGSTAVCSPVGKFTSCIDVGGAGTFSGNLLVQKSQPQLQLYQTGADNNYSILGNSSTALEFWWGTYGSNTTKILSLAASTGAATFSSTITGTTIYGSTTVCSPSIIACTTSAAAITIDGYSKLSFKDRGTEYGTINASRYNFGGESTMMSFQSGNCFLFLNGTNCLMFIGSNGNVGIGTTSTSTEANLFLGAQGANEGGQMVLQKGTSYQCATHIDNFNNCFRIMTGTNISSAVVNMTIDHTTGNACFLGSVMATVGYFSGCVGIGTTGPQSKLTISEGDIRLFKTHVYQCEATWKANIFFTDEVDRKGASIVGERTAWDGAPMGLGFETGGVGTITRRMTIASTGMVSFSCDISIDNSKKLFFLGAGDGNWFMGVDSTFNTIIAGAGSGARSFILRDTTSGNIDRLKINWLTGISCFGGTVCAPCFATISDYRMKSNIRPIEGLSIIMNTKPYKFEYNYDCSTSFGMIAHELQDTLPEAVFGYKDGEVMQGVDYMKLLPITIKAIQEQQCTICSQATMINTLKTCLGIA